MKSLLSLAGLVLALSSSLTVSSATLAEIAGPDTAAHPHSEHPHLVVSETLAVNQVFQAAVANAPEQVLGGAYRQQAEAQQQMSQRFIANRPRLNLYYWDDQAGDNTGLREMELGVEVDLWRWGERRNAKALAESFDTGASAWRDYQRLSVSGRLRRALHQLNSSAAKREHAVAAVTDAQRLLTISEQRFKAGEIARADVMQSEALLLESRQQLLEREAELVDAERQYMTLTGLQQRPAQFIEVRPGQPRIDAQHPQLRLLLAKRQQQTELWQQKRHEAAGNSTVSLGVRRERGSNLDPETESLGLSISIPFGGSAHTNAASASAAVAMTDADVRLKQARLQLQQQLHEVEHELDVLEESLAYAAQARDLAQRHWKMADKAFAAGESNIRPTILALQHFRQSQLQWQLLQLRQHSLISSLRQTVGESL